GFATGDTTYGFNNTGDVAYQITGATQQVVFCIWDGGGTDTLDVSGYASNQTIDLRPAGFSSVGALTKNVSIAQGTIIENAIGGTGDDRLIGNAADNVLTGGAGKDTIDGGEGINTSVYAGAAKNYTVTIAAAASQMTVHDKVGSDGTDTLTN